MSTLMPHLPQNLTFDFDAAPVPFAPGSHTSFEAARQIAAIGRRPSKTRAYLLELRAAGAQGLTDQEAARAVALRLNLPRGLPVQSICSIRGNCREALLVEKAGIVTGDWGKPNQRFRLTAAGRRMAEAL